MSKNISEQIDNVRITLDSIIKQVDEKYGTDSVWSELCRIKDDLGMTSLALEKVEYEIPFRTKSR